MNVVRFYETLAKIIGEREGVEIKVKVKEVTENRTVSTSKKCHRKGDESKCRR